MEILSLDLSGYITMCILAYNLVRQSKKKGLQGWH